MGTTHGLEESGIIKGYSTSQKRPMPLWLKSPLGISTQNQQRKKWKLWKMKCKKLFPWPENLTTMQMQHPIVSEFLKWPGRGLSHPVTRSGGFTSWTKGNLISTSWRRVSGLTRGEMGQAETLIVYEGELKSAHFFTAEMIQVLSRSIQIFFSCAFSTCAIFRCHLTHYSGANNKDDVFKKFPSSMLKWIVE